MHVLLLLKTNAKIENYFNIPIFTPKNGIAIPYLRHNHDG